MCVILTRILKLLYHNENNNFKYAKDIVIM